ncbi:Fur-regulated protein [Escherichia coli]|uniref:Fur-regulated protein n=1 Tax=Escherichia coli TaxID=562 RepID=UPI0035A8B9D2
MGQKIITLSGAATDVLYALFFRGALKSGDLPAKSGAAELRELGFAETRHTATEHQKENYFTFLTAEGQEFAIKHLANTRFGKPVDKQYCSAITIGVELDTSAVQKALDELDDKIRKSDAFKVLKDGWSFDKDGALTINNGQVFITDAKIGDAMKSDFDLHPGINDNVDYLIKTVKASQAAMQELEATIAQQASVIAGFNEDIAKAVRDEIAKQLKPGGATWNAIRRGF